MRKLFAALVALCILLTSTMPAFAASSEAAPVDDGGPYYISYDKDGNILSYNMPIPLESTLAEDGTYLSSTRLGDGYVAKVDCGEHPDTPVWRRVSEYSFSSDKTFGVSFSGTAKVNAKIVEFSGTASVSIGVATNFGYKIPADVNKDSKLKVECDFYITLWRGDVRDANTHELIYSFEYTTYTKDAERFLVRYRGEQW